MKPEFKVTCPFCSVGCRFKILKGLDEVLFSSRTQDVIDFDYEDPMNSGSLCPRGHFSYELLSHPKRLGRAFYKNNGRLRPEIPEILFKKISGDLKKRNSKNPLAILIDPMLSIHDIRALFDFANNNGITSIDLNIPEDRHLFRAMLDNPFDYPQCVEAKILKDLNHILCIGDVFTKQPVLSRHLLKAKYTFKKNSLLHINPINCRTSWFANVQVLNEPYTETFHLAYIYSLIFNKQKNNLKKDEFHWLNKIIKEKILPIIDEFIAADQKCALSDIVNTLLDDSRKIIFYSNHYYNAAASYLNGILCAAISQLSDSYYVPLYSDSNLYALEELVTDIYPNFGIGYKPTLYHLVNNNFEYLFAAGWNPTSSIPGNINFVNNSKLIISSIVQNEFPQNTITLLPQAHIYEQLDLRTNFIPLQSKGSEPIKRPIGSAYPISHFTYLFHQKISEDNISLKNEPIKFDKKSWQDNFTQEVDYYLDKIQNFKLKNKLWLIPIDHIAHYKDASLTKYSTWAQRDCFDDTFRISQDNAAKARLKDNKYFHLKQNGTKCRFKARIIKQISNNKLAAYSHYLPLRKIIPSEFAEHNKEYYFWCPQVELKDISSTD